MRVALPCPAHPTPWALAPILALALACSDAGEPSDTGPADVVDASDLSSDVPTDDGGEPDAGTCPGAPGCLCARGSECDSELCIDSIEGTVCSLLCGLGQDCPRGWGCDEVSLGGDPIYGCVPRAPNLCRPCRTDDDCLPVGGDAEGTWRCVDEPGGGKACGAPCDTNADCPDKPVVFVCETLDLPGGADRQCRPAQGACPCTAKFKVAGFLTTCDVQNAHGTCPGQRTCDGECTGQVPAAEDCNGLDENCDGQADEGVTGRACQITNAHGSCPGTTECAEGVWSPCLGTPPELETCNGLDDDCNEGVDEGFPNLDGDLLADCVDDDRDGDGVPDAADNCTDDANPDQANNDAAEEEGVALGDACDDDDDNDGLPDVSDLCPRVKGGVTDDSDADGKGDTCDCDADNDGVGNDGVLDLAGTRCPAVLPAFDNCPRVGNGLQEDTDADGTGDACDCDVDGDGVFNNNPGCPVPSPADNCRTVKNPDQANGDGDAWGDACDCDLDNDGYPNDNNACPTAAPRDNCMLTPNADQGNADGDAQGDACDCDADNDGVGNPGPGCPPCGTCDNCWLVANPDQGNTTGTPWGDACNPDLDGDGISNVVDNCPLLKNLLQQNADGDDSGDACDCDRDDDGFGNGGVDRNGEACIPTATADNCPDIGNPAQDDQDEDDTGDACDCDVDGDGDPQPNFGCPTPTPLDCAPLDPARHHGADERCLDGVDNDCDGFVDEPPCT